MKSSNARKRGRRAGTPITPRIDFRKELAGMFDLKEIAGPALFFASPASDSVTGQTLYVDGGITASQ